MWILDRDKNLINLSLVVEIRRDGKYIVAIDTNKVWHYIKECETEEEAIAAHNRLIENVKRADDTFSHVLDGSYTLGGK